MPPRLRQHAHARVHQHHREIGGRRAGDHVACILLVPRAVGDDEPPALSAEEAVRDVDGDPLLALGRQPVHQQREVELRPSRPVPRGLGGQAVELVVEQRAGIVQQPPDQRRLAVVHRPAGDKAQQARLSTVISAQAGTHCALAVGSMRHRRFLNQNRGSEWVPACAGMTRCSDTVHDIARSSIVAHTSLSSRRRPGPIARWPSGPCATFGAFTRTAAPNGSRPSPG